MVVPFNGVITISRDVAVQMNQEITNFCLATRDVRDAKEHYRHEHPTPEQALDSYYKEIDAQIALLKLAKLVLENVIDPNFN